MPVAMIGVSAVIPSVASAVMWGSATCYVMECHLWWGSASCDVGSAVCDGGGVPPVMWGVLSVMGGGVPPVMW